jgi:ABC-type phosphate transport system substrate-binding protein
MRNSGRRATVLAALAALLLLAVGAASASACPTTSIAGQGSTLQNVAQERWIGGYEVLCPRLVRYTGTGSGAGLRAWHAEGSAGTVVESGDAFIGTDDAPTGTQIGRIKERANNATVAVIPVAQAAISLPIRPPAECTIRQITNRQLSAIFEGTLTRWERLTVATGSCETNRTIRIWARRDLSGTTYQFKHYLGLIREATRWRELQRIERNTEWPITVEKPAGTGGGELVAAVAANAGSIGYANLADAQGRTNVTLLNVQNTGTTETTEPGQFAAPANGRNANCEQASYAGRRELEGDWSEVYGSETTTGTYPICTLTWDVFLARTAGGSGYTTASFAAGTGATAEEYARYIVNAGQTAFANNFYEGLPSGILTTARGFAAEVR